MNKLELLYKMAGTMKKKEKVNGIVNIVAIEGGKEFVNVVNNFSKDCEAGTMNIDAHAVVSIGDLNVDKSIKKELNMKEMHEKHHGKKCCGGRKKNKFEKLEMMFKALNDMKVSKEGNLNVIELDVTGMLKKKKEKMKEHAHNHDHGNACGEVKCDELKEILQVKHAIFKELISADYSSAVLNLVVNEDNSIKELRLVANGDKNFKISVNLNY